MKPTLVDLYHRHVAAVFDRQMRLTDFLEENGGGKEWGYNVPSASLTLGQTVRFEAPLLGSFAEDNATWLWAWANRHLNLPAENRTLAEAVCGLEKVHDLPLFLSGEPIPCEKVLPEQLIEGAAHVFGVIVAGELGYDAYYTLLYEGGRGVALILDARLRVAESHLLVRISTIFPQAISAYPILDHRAAFIAFVESYGFEVTSERWKVSVRSARDEVMTADFDEQNRMTKLEGRIPPAK